jgi:hypothetical protein
MKEKQWNKVIMETYAELYLQANPPADFLKLYEEAEIDEMGNKIIPYNDYRINPELLHAIVIKMERKYKMTDYQAQKFRVTIYLGCSPIDEK